MKRQPFGTRDFGGGTWDKSKDPTTNSDNSNWKPVLIMNDGERCNNGLVFKTYRDALESAKDTFSRWTTPSAFEVEATKEPVNCFTERSHKSVDYRDAYDIQVDTGRNISTSDEPLE